MKKFAVKTYGKIVAFILSLIGLLTTAESCDERDNNIQPMYGVPTADFVIKGKVTDVTTSRPISNIQIVVPHSGSTMHSDTVYTNVDGEFSIKQSDFPVFNEPKTVIATDIDGDANGVYYPDTIKVSFTSKDKIKEGSGSWYDGVYEKTNQNFKLKKVEIIPMYGVMPAKFEKNENKDG